MSLAKPGRQVSRTASIPAPTGGLNSKDAISNMKPTDAVIMENWFPTPSSVDIRNGSNSYATGLGGFVETLLAYNSGGTKSMFGIAAGNIYNVTVSGPVGAAVVTGLSNSRFQYVTLGTAGGYYLLAVNGIDKMRYYDGTSWTSDGGTYTVTGVNTQNIIHINNFKNRVWLIENSSMRAWYLPVSSIAGAAAALDLSGLFKLGGYLMAMANWTIDNASGVDDYAAFLTSEGEVAIYKGTDPTSSSTWSLVGTFRQGPPIGRRCYCKAGSDVLILTTDGAFPLSKSLLTDRTQLNQAASDKIRDLITDDIIAYKSNFGWQPIIYPLGSKLIINIPMTEDTTSYQYVMNTTNLSWSKFTGWNAFCFETLGDNLFYGGNGTVYQADIGTSDNGAAITTQCQQAFNYFGARGQQKKFNMIRPIFISNGTVRPAVLINVDFQENRTTVAPSYSGNPGSPWDTSPWDTSPWTSGNTLLKQWQSVSGVGYAGGINVSTQTADLQCSWQSTDVVYEIGGVL